MVAVLGIVAMLGTAALIFAFTDSTEIIALSVAAVLIVYMMYY